MIGETITVNGVKCLVLDEINGNPFVIALRQYYAYYHGQHGIQRG